MHAVRGLDRTLIRNQTIGTEDFESLELDSIDPLPESQDPITTFFDGELTIQVSAHKQRASVSQDNRIPTWIAIHIPGCQHRRLVEHPEHRLSSTCSQHEHRHGRPNHDRDADRPVTEPAARTESTKSEKHQTCLCSLMKWWSEPKECTNTR